MNSTTVAAKRSSKRDKLAEADRHHAGCILIWTLGHHEFAAIIDGVNRLLAARPDPATWHDLVVAL